MAGFSKSLAHLLKLDFVLLGYSNFLLIILDSKEQSKSQGTYSEYTLLYTTKWTIQKYKWTLFSLVISTVERQPLKYQMYNHEQLYQKN